MRVITLLLFIGSLFILLYYDESRFCVVPGGRFGKRWPDRLNKLPSTTGAYLYDNNNNILCLPVVFRIRRELFLAQLLYGAQALRLGGYTLRPLFTRPGNAIQKRRERFGDEILTRRRRERRHDGRYVVVHRYSGGGRHRIAKRKHALEHVQMGPEFLYLVVPGLQQRFQFVDQSVLCFQQCFQVLCVHRSRHI